MSKGKQCAYNETCPYLIPLSQLITIILQFIEIVATKIVESELMVKGEIQVSMRGPNVFVIYDTRIKPLAVVHLKYIPSFYMLVAVRSLGWYKLKVL